MVWALRQYLHGMTPKGSTISSLEIADRLAISLKIARNHVSNILSKLQVTDRAQAMVKARQVGLG